ncbi:MAG: hypothetical protein OS112_01470 [Methanoregula sp.]|nr:MAG: hypothetical protein OS112_01470 [Methanoregula sp.]
MADTTVQREVERWIRKYWMPDHFKEDFETKKLKLSSGGDFKFDAVNKENTIVANISTSSAVTARGKRAIGKLHKIRADLYFLLLLQNVKRKLLIFTEKDMVQYWENEKLNGRMPQDIEIHHAVLTEDIQVKLNTAKKVASDEVSNR